MRVLSIILLISTVIVPSASVVTAVPLVEGEITLDQAVEAALRLSPSLGAARHSVSASEARATQAGLLPNPEISLETENFGGSGEFDGFEAAETTAVISQEILLGGKRRRGRAVAESDQILAGRDLEAARLDVVSRTTLAYYRVLTAQERESLSEELLALADRFAKTVRARVDAGKVSPVEGTRADIEVAQARVRRTRAVRDLKAARVRLAATWGSGVVSFDRAVGELPRPTPPPSLEQLRSLLLQTPEIVRLEDRIQRQQNVLDVESAFRIPDLTVSLGPRRFSETGQSAWVAGISLPIPIFDRNQGSRKAAEFELERVRRDVEAVRVAIEAELAAGLERLHAAQQETEIMNNQVVPAAEAAFTATEKGYTEGKFGFLDVLDAQRALFESRSLLLDSREEYALILTELERLIGMAPSAARPSQGE
ncbi:MAG: TolC family protein [Acidobacteria bacterium]|nr:TolC family protein [Acidobacteriota bacterium]